jgi:AraC-like DNA-binding protein
MQEILRSPETSQKLIEALSPVLSPNSLKRTKKTITSLDSINSLTMQEKYMLFCVAIWSQDPRLKGKIAQNVGITREMIESYSVIVSDNQELVDIYTRLTEIIESTEPSQPQTLEFKQLLPSQLMTKIKDMRDKGSSIREITDRLQHPIATIYSYNSLLTRGGKTPKFRNNNHPKPETLQLERYVAGTLRKYSSTDQRISNDQLAEMATQKLNRKITKSMIKNAIHRASVHEEVPTRKPRKTNKTWSPTKKEGENTKNKVREALILHANQHPGEPIILFDIAKDLSLNPHYLRRIYNSLSKKEMVPPTKRKPYKSSIPSDILSIVRTNLIEVVRNHRQKNPNQPISINELARQTGRSRSLTSRLYEEIFGQDMTASENL